MSAVTATEQPVVLDRLAVLSAGGETDRSRVGSLKSSESYKVAQRLRAIQPAGGKETIRAALAIKEGETRFNIHNVKEFGDKFGAGKKDISKMEPSEKASFQKAREVLKQNAELALFLRARTHSNPERNTYVSEALQKDLGEPPLNYNALRQKVLWQVARDPSFKALFPEVGKGMSGLNELPDFIEQTLFPADDQRFEARLGTHMQEAFKKALDFSSVVTDETRVGLERSKAEDGLRLTQEIKSIKQFLEGRRINNPSSGNPYTEAEIKDLIQNKALTAESALDAIAFNLLGVAGVSNAEFTQMKKYVLEMPKNRDGLRGILEAARLAVIPSPADLAAYIAAYPNNQTVKDYVAQEQEYTRLDAKYGPASGSVNINTFRVRVLPLYSDTSVAEVVSNAKKLDLKIKDAGIKLTLPAATAEEIQRSHDKRIIQEEELCGELDNILGQTFADVLEERYDIMEERMGRLTSEDQKKAEQEIQKMVLELKKKMNSNWIGFNATNHRKTVNKDQIKTDVTHLGFTYDKDMALKQLIARDLFVGKPHVNLTTTNYNQLNVIDGKSGANPNVTLLNEKQLKQVDEVFKLAGQEYRDKLFADMLMARGVLDRSWNFGFGLEAVSGQLGFKRGEWEQMLKLYEPEITKGLESNTEAKAALQSLEAQGVKVDTKLKGIWYILAVILGGSLGGLVGPGLTTIATGAAKGIGSQIAAGKISLAAGEIGGAIAGGVGGKKLIEHFSQN